MEYTYLGRTGLKVSRICLGTMNFGGLTPEDESFRIMNFALDQGINFFDTADVYGPGDGGTESLLGRWFEQVPGNREQIILATKVYNATGEGPNDRHLSALHIRKACEASLRRLGTDYIDLYQMHHIHNRTPWEEIWQAMEQLVREGKIIYVGSSNFAAWNLVQANTVAEQRNFLGLVSEQSTYSLRNRNIELEVIPACRALGLGLMPYSPLGGGALCGEVLDQPQTGSRGHKNMQAFVAKHREQIEAYESLCKEIGQDPPHVALAWVLKNPVVTSPILGPRTFDQMGEVISGMDLKLTDETIQSLEKIWPGLGGEAPEAYI